MKTNDLLTIWGAPEPPRLTPKQLSIRLPILVSAKISALLDLYPKRTKTDIIGDLLITALEMLEKELPMYMLTNGKGPADIDELGEGLFEYFGTRKEFFNLTEKYLREMEKEADVKEPMKYSYPDFYSESDFKWQ
jgi:hypothetical protein